MYEQLKPSLQRKGLHSHSHSHSHSVYAGNSTVSDSDGSDCDAAGVPHWASSSSPTGTGCRRRGDDQFESHSSFSCSASTVPPTTCTPSKLAVPHSPPSTERGASSSNHQLLDHDEVDREHESRASAFIAMEMEEMDCHQIQCHIQHLHGQHLAANGSKSGNLRVHKAAPKGHSSRHQNASFHRRDHGHSSPSPMDHGHGHHGAAAVHDASASGLDPTAGAVAVHGDSGELGAGSGQSPSGCGRVFEGAMSPFHFAFKWTVPKTNGQSPTWKLMLSFCLVLVWLGVLTFVCVDAAEKMGNCLKISEDVMGLTLLAIGSSLPDCFSSVLAAKQGKGEMAVSNALGSNVFDINICIGVSFLTSSMVKGFKAIYVEHDEGFELFIAALFVLLAIFMVAMFCYGLVLNKNIGAGLMAAYAVFLGAFCYLLQFD